MEVSPIGINLTGGGARGSYQAGVLLGVSEVLRDLKLTGLQNPIKNWSGVSAGAINATYAAAGADQISESCRRLADVWAEIQPNRVYRTDVMTLGKNSARWIRDLTFGPLFGTKLAKALLDTEPLYQLIEGGVFFKDIQKNIDAGILDGLACSAYSYETSKTITFLQSEKANAWDKPTRSSQKVKINARHVIASCAIPIVFPAIEIGDEFFGDGGFRSTSPISPVIHMGSKKIFIVGVQGPNELAGRASVGNPGIAKIGGAMLNALFFDTFDIDLERMGHINEIIRALKKNVSTERSDYSEIDFMVVRPSRDIAAIAEGRIRKGLPKTVEFLLGGLGGPAETSELASYILFESNFTKELLDLGYSDFMNQKSEFEKWLCRV